MNLDEILSNAGIDLHSTSSRNDTGSQEEQPVEENPQEEIVEETPQSEETAFSEDDINEVLLANGIMPPTEYISEDDEDDEEDLKYEEEVRVPMRRVNELLSINTPDIQANASLEPTTARDFDAEEDAAWEGAQEVNVQQEEVQQEPDITIPVNSPTILIDDTTSRFSGTEWYNEIQKQRIILAGLGGIGSWTAVQLARMNPEALYLYDDDIVELANMSGQFYSNNDVGASKVSAVSNIIGRYTNTEGLCTFAERFTRDTEPGDIMICGFDNMRARKDFFISWLTHIESKSDEDKKKCLFIDGRLSIDTLQVFCITGDSDDRIERYRDEALFFDSEADETVCSMKQTTYLACMIGSIIVNLFTNYVANLLDPVIPYDLPYFTQYESQFMIFKTEC